MASPSLTPERRAELLASLRESRELNARSRENVRRQVAILRRIAAERRARRFWF
jgi:hypothetical protein